MNSRGVSAIGAAMWAILRGSLFLVIPHPVFALVTPTLTGQASTPALAGGSLTDTVTITGGASPTGMLTFQLFSGACGGSPIFTSVKTVNGNGAYTSDPYIGLANATFYQWQTSYNGDGSNSPATTPPACNGSESVSVPQYCPPPPSCLLAGPCSGPGGTTYSITVTSCTGNAAHTSALTTTFIGPLGGQTVCTGVDKQTSFCNAAGGTILVTDVETVSAFVAAIPTLSIWALWTLVAGLGALALRRIRC
jgi:hypothetical protein